MENEIKEEKDYSLEDLKQKLIDSLVKKLNDEKMLSENDVAIVNILFE